MAEVGVISSPCPLRGMPRERCLTPLAVLTMWGSGGPASLTGWSGLTEVPKVSLSAWEQRTLSCVADELAASDPKLASILAVFNRLTSGEAMPAHQHAGGIRREVGHRSRRSRRHTWKRRRQVCLTVGVAWPAIAWILITAALITGALVLSHIGHGPDGRWRCTQSWPVTCAGR